MEPEEVEPEEVFDAVLSGEMLLPEFLAWLRVRSEASSVTNGQPNEADALRSRLEELEQRLARVAELAHDRDDDTLERRSRRLGQCASISWDHMEETFSTDPLKKRSTLKWAHLAKQLSDSEALVEQLKGELAHR